MKHTSSYITLNKDSLKNNIKFIRKNLGVNTRISSVVKANAYGHGIKEMVPLLCDLEIDHFSVFDYFEAIKVYNSLTRKADIAIMGYVSNDCIRDSILKGFEIYCFTSERIEALNKESARLGIPAKIHLEVETGLNRSGLDDHELDKAIKIINNNRNNFFLTGICTHLAGADSIENHLRIQKQIKKYKKYILSLAEKGLDPAYRHIANSAAAFTYPKTRLNMVRMGIMQYGYWPGAETFIHYINNRSAKTDPLDRVLEWKSSIMAIKKVKTGQFVSYGLSYLAQSDMISALIPVGYSIGYSRSLSNRGRVLIRGNRCSVIGLVNMNMIIADVSNVEGAEIGDEVVLIGKQENLEIKVSAFSEISEMLNYEVITSLSETIARKVI